MKYLISFLLLISFLKTSAQKGSLVLVNDLENISDSLSWMNLETAKKGNAFSGAYFSSTDSVMQYGLGFRNKIPSAYRNKSISILFSEYIRTNLMGTQFAMVITLSKGDAVAYWESKNISDRVTKNNEWQRIDDKIEIPSTFTGEEFSLSIYLWNKDGRSVVDIDDLSIEFNERKLPSFLPEGYTPAISNVGWAKMSGSKAFNVFYNKEAGLFLLLNANGDTLFNSFSFVTEWYDENSKIKKQSWNKRLNFLKDSISEEGNYIFLSARDDLFENELMLFEGNDNRIEISVRSIAKKNVIIVRHSLVIPYTLPEKELFRKNTLSDTSGFKDEYWLAREGFRLSDEKTSILCYRPAQVSSLQLDCVNNLIIANMDYAADHPMLHFPLLKKNQNIFEDYSTSLYKKNDTIRSELSFYVVKPEFKMAKILNNPNGYLSSFVWTEHADFTNLRTQRAVYFGGENISQLEKATGGFLRYSIPVTKSIFYSNPDRVDNSEKWKMLPGPIATFKEDEGFKTFLRQLNEYGIEICLHTPDHYTTDRKLLAEALEVTKREFTPETWIDHGYDNSIKSNREDLACDGFDKNSKFYSADLFKNYNIRYFWNSFYEDSGVYKDYSFNSFFSVPYTGLGDAMPTPEYWKHVTRTGDIIHWRTTSTIDPPDGSLWSYYFNDARLSDAVSNRNNIIFHCYPARVDSTNGYYLFRDGVIVANDEFNKALQKLSVYRSDGKIWLTTIREMLHYRKAIESIKFSTENDNIMLYNSGKDIIRGVTLSSFSNQVAAEGKEILSKKEGNEFIFWFDMNPGEKLRLTIK